jgi:hypothetical protein
MLSDGRVTAPLVVAGRVAWASPHSPWRLGIAFDEAQVGASTRFVNDLLEAYPALTPAPRFPERIRLDAVVYLGAPPRHVVDFTRAEVDLLRAVASGASIEELLACFRGDRWPPIQTALYSLLSRQHLTLSRGAAVLSESWREILAQQESLHAAAALADVHAPTPPPGWARTPPPAAAARTGATVVAPVAAAPPVPAAAWRGPSEPARARASTRTPEAQSCYDRALAEASAGNTAAAVALLRRALALAPGDADIADALGKAAFTGRRPGR